MYWLTSAAADRAALIDAALAGGTGFQQFSFELQYISLRRGDSAASAWCFGTSIASFT
jgi:hypothetical protein